MIKLANLFFFFFEGGGGGVGGGGGGGIFDANIRNFHCIFTSYRIGKLQKTDFLLENKKRRQRRITSVLFITTSFN